MQRKKSLVVEEEQDLSSKTVVVVMVLMCLHYGKKRRRLPRWAEANLQGDLDWYWVDRGKSDGSRREQRRARKEEEEPSESKITEDAEWVELDLGNYCDLIEDLGFKFKRLVRFGLGSQSLNLNQTLKWLNRITRRGLVWSVHSWSAISSHP